MMTQRLTDKKSAKIKFFVFYTVSILLLLVLFASFAKGSKTVVERSAALSSSGSAGRIAIDDLLHHRLEALQNVRAKYAGKDTSNAASEAIMAEKASFLAVVDSVRKSTASLPDGEKEEIERLLSTFSRDAESGVVVLKNTVSVPRDNSSASTAASKANAELTELKSILAQKELQIQQLQQNSTNAAALQDKDKTITALQAKVNQLQTALSQQPKVTQQAVVKTDASAAEWKDKYSRMKELSDKQKETINQYISQSNALKTSYKEVIEDNKRLVNQLQAIRAGKN